MIKFSAQITVRNGKIYIIPNYDCKNKNVNVYILLEKMIKQSNIHVLPF